MRLSIALATCNGARHLREQLDSFASQTRPPDEVVACDDRSDDRTPEILAEFAARAPFPVVIRRHEARLGIMKNFEAAVALCTGDVVFFSDQDDVWLPQKLARHEEIYRAEAGVGMVFSDGTIVDDTLRPTGQTLWGYTGTTPRRRRRIEGPRAFGLIVRRSFAYGCTMSFRSALRDLLLPFPYEYLHDVWVQTVLAPFVRFRALAEPLILYRRHASQSVGINPSAGLDPATARRNRIDAQVASLECLVARLDAHGGVPGGDGLRPARSRLAHLRRRRSLGRGASGLIGVARELASGNYLRLGEHPASELRADLRVALAGGGLSAGQQH